MTKVLEGLRVLAVEQYGAGPFGTQLLADLGAEVIKIENPTDGGDVSRQLGPFWSDALEDSAGSLFYQSINRNKHSVAIDLSRPEGQAAFHRLAATADAVACNLRGDVPGKLGLTYETLGAVRRDLVCCHLTAYGRTGARANWPGYDYLIQAEAGYFGINGEADAPPSRFGLSIVDFMTGYALALAVASGVLEARRTGRGRDIDVSLFDVGMANLNYLATWALNTDYRPQRQRRSAHPSLTPCQLFPTADGWIYIMANKEKFWPRLCRVVGLPDLADDPQFRTFADRLAHRPAMEEHLDAAFARAGTADWLEKLAGLVPAAPINTVDEALASRFVEESGLVQTLEREGRPTGVKVIASPFRTGETAAAEAGPVLGGDTRRLLADAGLSDADLARLEEEGIIR